MTLKFHFYFLLLSIAVDFFACLRQELFHHYCKECMGRQPCLFVCYGEQDQHQTMDGGRSDYIEERFA
jgi:hypothetical protein